MKINLNYSIRRPFELNSALSSSVTFAFSSSILIFSFERSSMLSLIVVASWCFCAKIFLRESHGSRWIIRSHKSQLVIYCFQSLANFPLALSFGHETAAKVFLVGTSGPKGQVEFWQNTIWELSVFALWVWETTPGLHLSTSLHLHFHLFPHPMCHQQSQE